MASSCELRTRLGLCRQTTPNDFDVIQGLLYVPDITGVENDCSNETLSLIPRNVTRRADLPPNDYPFIAFAPWTEIGCVQAYLAVMRMEAVRGAIFYQHDSSNTRPPPRQRSYVESTRRRAMERSELVPDLCATWCYWNDTHTPAFAVLWQHLLRTFRRATRHDV